MRRIWLIGLLLVGAGCSTSNDSEGVVTKPDKVEVVQPKPGDLSPEERAAKNRGGGEGN